LDEKQKTAKTLRNAIAYKKDAGKGKLYLVIARQATVSDLADVMKAMQVDYAINLDGGYSSALIYNDEYMVGPGRNIPNAIIFTIQP
jgi:exopolysaccharide biosynthesis protein